MRGTALRGAVALLAAVLWPLGATGQSGTSQSGTSQNGRPTPLIPPSVTLPMGPDRPGRGPGNRLGNPGGADHLDAIAAADWDPASCCGARGRTGAAPARERRRQERRRARAGAASGRGAGVTAPVPEHLGSAGFAQIQVLDKIDALAKDLSVKVGQSVSYGALTIGVQSCVVRPPDQPADAAAFLVITDSHKGEPGFRGWSLAHEPWLSMLQNPIYNVLGGRLRGLSSGVRRRCENRCTSGLTPRHRWTTWQ